MSPEEKAENLAHVAELKEIVHRLYGTLFQAGTGSRFHAFLEWCGVLSEHLKIAEGLLKKDVDVFNMSGHTGTPLPIPFFQLAYLAEKMECIFGGALEISVRKKTS